MAKRQAEPENPIPQVDRTATAVAQARAAAKRAAEDMLARALATVQADRTAGPWYVDAWPTHHPDLFLYTIKAPRGWQNPDGTYFECCVAAELDSLGDARLIAAAPDLLAYVQQRADAGDLEAQALMAQANGDTERLEALRSELDTRGCPASVSA